MKERATGTRDMRLTMRLALKKKKWLDGVETEVRKGQNGEFLGALKQ